MPSSDPWRRRRRAGGTPAAATAAALVTLLVVASTALAGVPTASPAGGDPRSPGEGPGLVGDPLVAVVLVVGIGLFALLATLAWVRFTAPPPS